MRNQIAQICNCTTVLYNGMTIQCTKDAGHRGPHLKVCGPCSYYRWDQKPEIEIWAEVKTFVDTWITVNYAPSPKGNAELSVAIQALINRALKEQ